ncbi:leucyl-tRNA synthetase [Biscogniauxia marginata]|nr:leucyl-tRNA synthetase [Biscogniauxia marginata]
MPSAAIKIAGQLRPRLKLPIRASSILRRTYATEPLDLPALDEKWRRVWIRRERFESMRTDAHFKDPTQRFLGPESSKSSGRNMYILPMFPYPSGDLHLGHLRVYTIADAVARFRRMQGRNVLLPIGWDAFGLPAENAAMERRVKPYAWSRDNIARMKKQLEMMNASFDWSREFATYEPRYYEQTQRIFLLLYKHGLAVQKKAFVNWDPLDKTVLANEQVNSEGRSWRSGAIVEQRELKQWFFCITKLKQSLLRDLDQLAEDNAWPERVLTMQKNWLGRTIGARYNFPIRGPPPFDSPTGALQKPKTIEVYTTRPETIFSAQFIALKPDAPLVLQAAEHHSDLRAFLDRVADQPRDTTEGFLIGFAHAFNPVDCEGGLINPDSVPLPIFVAPYVSADPVSGAAMGVPAHDARDFAFWKRHCSGEPIKYSITPNPSGDTVFTDEPFLEAGYMTRAAGQYFQQPSGTLAKELVSHIRAQSGLATLEKSWKIRDWLISRQRYWGTPIPIIHCSFCGPQPVPDCDLPVKLPRFPEWARGLPGNYLERSVTWCKVPCPRCNEDAMRDTDTMDTFVDSSWYYMRFADPANTYLPISEPALHNYLPVDMYIGGVEHAVLHLLYARFIYKALMGILYPKPIEPGKEYDTDVPEMAHQPQRDPSRAEEEEEEEDLILPDESRIPSTEPFKRLITQGMVHGKTYTDPDTGRYLKRDEIDFSDDASPKLITTGKPVKITFEKMSKSKYNGVDPTQYISNYGADATRAHILFQAPVGEVLNWDGQKILGVIRWLHRVYAHVQALAATGMTAGMSRSQFNGKLHFNKPQSALDAMNKEEAAQWNADVNVWRATQEAIMSVTTAFQNVYSLNTVVSTLMSLTNTMIDNPAASVIVNYKATRRLLRMMAPITPAFSEECWCILHGTSGKSIFDYGRWGWPAPDGSLFFLRPRTIRCAVQVNGKLRCVVEVPNRPTNMAEGSIEHKKWITEEILKVPEAQTKLAAPEYDIRKAKGTFLVRDGALVNFMIKKERK